MINRWHVGPQSPSTSANPWGTVNNSKTWWDGYRLHSTSLCNDYGLKWKLVELRNLKLLQRLGAVYRLATMSRMKEDDEIGKDYGDQWGLLYSTGQCMFPPSSVLVGVVGGEEAAEALLLVEYMLASSWPLPIFFLKRIRLLPNQLDTCRDDGAVNTGIVLSLVLQEPRNGELELELERERERERERKREKEGEKEKQRKRSREEGVAVSKDTLTLFSC